jgi:hypothetical protein
LKGGTIELESAKTVSRSETMAFSRRETFSPTLPAALTCLSSELMLLMSEFT